MGVPNNPNIVNTQNNVGGNNIPTNEISSNTNMEVPNSTENILYNDKTDKDLKGENNGKKKKVNIFIGILIAIVIILVGIFIVYPYVRDNLLVSPEKVFKKSIDNVNLTLEKQLDEYDFGDALYDLNLKVDSDQDDLKEYNNYTYGIKVGKDSENKLFESKMYMLDKNNNEYSYSTYIKNSKLYYKFSSYEKLILFEGPDNSSFENSIESLEGINNDDLKYLVNKISILLKDNLDKKNFSKSNANIKVNGKDVKVTKNTYKADKKEMARLTKCILNGLYKDSKALQIITKTYMTKEDFKESIDMISSELYENSEFNIYTKGYQFLGFDIYENNNSQFAYYTDGSNFDILLNSDAQGTVSASGVQKNGTLVVEIKSGDYKLASLDIKEYSNNKINLDYKINTGLGDDASGKLTYIKKADKDHSNYEVKLSMKNNSNNMNLNLNLNQDKRAVISDIDENSAVKLTEEEMQKLFNDFYTSLENTPVGALIHGTNYLEDSEI